MSSKCVASVCQVCVWHQLFLFFFFLQIFSGTFCKFSVVVKIVAFVDSQSNDVFLRTGQSGGSISPQNKNCGKILQGKKFMEGAISHCVKLAIDKKLCIQSQMWVQV